MMVTRDPMEAQAEANSTPMTPPPRMMADVGTWSSSRACSLVITGPEISWPMVLENEPEASTMFRPLYRLPLTSTTSLATRRPQPLITSMPRDETSPWRPLYIRATTPFLYFWTAGMSMPSKAALTPTAAASRTVLAVSAECRIALVGTQPR